MAPASSSTPTRSPAAGSPVAGNNNASIPSTPTAPSHNGRRQSTDSQTAVSPSSLAAGLGNLSLSPNQQYRFATSPGSGALGQRIQARVNYFPIDASQLPDVLEYGVQMQCEAENLRDGDIRGHTRERTFTLLLESDPMFRYAATDYGNKTFSTHALSPPDSTQTYMVNYYEPEDGPEVRRAGRKVFKVVVKYTRTYSSQYHRSVQGQPQGQTWVLPEDHLAAFNLLIGRGPSQDPNIVSTNRRQKIFNIPSNIGKYDLTGGIEMYQGFFRSAKSTSDGLVLNVNVACAATFKSGRLDETINQVLRLPNRALEEREQKFLNRFVRGIVVEHVYTGIPVRTTIMGIAQAPSGHRASASNVRFNRNGVSTSVEAHFRSTYPSVQRRDTNALVVWVRSSAGQQFIPSDMCRILPGQQYKQPLTAAQTSKMIKFACRRPADNKISIERDGLKQVGVNVPGGPRDRFAVSISQRMMQILARILPKPTLMYGSGPFSDVSAGMWLMTGKKFKQPAPQQLLRFSILEFNFPGTKTTRNLADFIRFLKEHIQRYTGVTRVEISTFPGFQHSRTITGCIDPDSLRGTWRFLKDKGIHVVFVILPDTSVDNYRAIKLTADAQGPGIHTVCVVRMKDGTVKVQADAIANLTLKVNAKLGGINLILQTPPQLRTLFNNRIMIIGADVTHPGPSAMVNAPSIAAMVATTGQDHFQYPGSWRLQRHKDDTKKSLEVIEQFGAMFEERLKFYYNRNQSMFPEVLIIYRDGVSDGMFGIVVSNEIRQMQQVCKKVYKNGKLPKIIFIVVTKRHHTRFFPPETGPRTGFDPNGNVLPGFVADQRINSNKHWDFYLASHKCIQGTSRPAHYIILHDEYGLSADEIQLLTHSQSYLFGRATKSISTHPAVRSADLLAYRIRVIMYDVYHCPSSPGEERPEFNIREYTNWDFRIGDDLKDTMFYI